MSGRVPARPLTRPQAQRYEEALRLLGAGQVRRALENARSLLAEAPDAADAHQLHAMCLADAGQAGAADAAFRQAMALAPGNEVVALNYAAWLRRAGRSRDGVEVLRDATPSAQVLALLGLLALDVGDHGLAIDAFERCVAASSDPVRAWHGLGNARQAGGDLEGAAQAFRKAVDLSPEYAPAWVNLGAALRLLGRLEDAIECFARARKLGHAGPAFDDMINGTLMDAGDMRTAYRQAVSLVEAHPDFVGGHDTLARMLWEYGEALDPEAGPFDRFRAAVDAQPGNRELALGYIRLLLSARRPAEALERIRAMKHRHGGDPQSTWLAADALDQLGEHGRAARLFEQLHGVLGGVSTEFLNAHARHAFRSGRPELARECASKALRIDERNQEAWSHLGVVWRLADDPREYWLNDYERLIALVPVEPPAGDGDFLATLESALERLHTAGREPVSQSVRNGSQTSGRLFGRNDRTIMAAESALRAAVESWLASLPEDERHPFLRYRRRSVRMVGSWSVRLWSSGRHSNHIHPEGWLSSAFYVALPPVVDRTGEQAGWIQFGQPLEELGLTLPPRRFVQPRAGHLALFPSYMWHGTVPFDDVAPRLTVAFDAQPAD